MKNIKSKMIISALIALPLLLTTVAFAKVSTPQEIISRQDAHCQSPNWSPDGKKLAVDIYQPKTESQQVVLVKLSDSFLPIKEQNVSILGQSSSKLAGGKLPPIVEFAWAPASLEIDQPYIFSSQGAKKNFDLYLDGSWITENPGNDGQPAFSPSGNFIAYTSQREKSGDIMLYNIANSQISPLNETANTTEYTPTWHPSPEKDTLLIVRSQGEKRGQDLVLIEDVKNGKAEKLLTDWKGDEVRPTWSPNGEWIAFYFNEKSKDSKLFDLWVIRKDGTEAQQIANDVVADEQGPVWTSDSAVVLYVQRDFSKFNPIKWVRVADKKSGVLTADTQLNSDLAIFYKSSGEMALAYRAQGTQDAKDKTWQRVYILTFTMDDLQ